MSTATARRLYVISDIHLGGPHPSGPDDRGFRMMTNPAALGAFIEAVTAAHPKEGEGPAAELVINGDFLDFLAEPRAGDPTWVPFREGVAEAEAAFAEMLKRPEDRPVFDALAGLLEAGIGLTILVGNHDLELFVDPVQRAFEARVGATPERHVSWIVDEPFYRVGSVHIEHGNAFDPYNDIDREGYRDLRQRIAEKRRPQDARFVAPRGSRIVAQVMNPIKRDYAFIDLLKPERPSLYALLLVLAPNRWSTIRELQAAASDRKARQALAPEGRAGRAESESALESMNLESMNLESMNLESMNLESTELESDEALLDEAFGVDAAANPELAAALHRFVAKPVAPAADEGAEEGLESFSEGLRRALEWLPTAGLLLTPLLSPTAETRDSLILLRAAIRQQEQDETFNPFVETLKDIDEGVTACLARKSTATPLPGMEATSAQKPSVVILGHTHHARWIRHASGAVYVNTGTWANLMRFPHDLFDDDEAASIKALQRFVEHVRANDLRRYIAFRPTYACVDLDAQGAALRTTLGHFKEGEALDAPTRVTHDGTLDVVDVRRALTTDP